jgi:hypothetical protein
MRLKASEVAQYRLSLLTKQGHKCALCNQPCTAEEAVLDHCHTTGLVRAVLHRGCNALEGKITNSLKMNRIDEIRLRMILLNLVDYQKTTTDVYHHTYRTAEEKKERTKRRAKLRKKRAS